MTKTEEFIASFKALLKRYNAKLLTVGDGQVIDSTPGTMNVSNDEVYVDLEWLSKQIYWESEE